VLPTAPWLWASNFVLKGRCKTAYLDSTLTFSAENPVEPAKYTKRKAFSIGSVDFAVGLLVRLMHVLRGVELCLQFPVHCLLQT
jgi:hypothetical protein